MLLSFVISCTTGTKNVLRASSLILNPQFDYYLSSRLLNLMFLVAWIPLSVGILLVPYFTDIHYASD
jgi:hypothetical protein